MKWPPSTSNEVPIWQTPTHGSGTLHHVKQVTSHCRDKWVISLILNQPVVIYVGELSSNQWKAQQESFPVLFWKGPGKNKISYVHCHNAYHPAKQNTAPHIHIPIKSNELWSFLNESEHSQALIISPSRSGCACNVLWDTTLHDSRFTLAPSTHYHRCIFLYAAAVRYKKLLLDKHYNAAFPPAPSWSPGLGKRYTLCKSTFTHTHTCTAPFAHVQPANPLTLPPHMDVLTTQHPDFTSKPLRTLAASWCRLSCASRPLAARVLVRLAKCFLSGPNPTPTLRRKISDKSTATKIAMGPHVILGGKAMGPHWVSQ